MKNVEMYAHFDVLVWGLSPSVFSIDYDFETSYAIRFKTKWLVCAHKIFYSLAPMTKE